MNANNQKDRKKLNVKRHLKNIFLKLSFKIAESISRRLILNDCQSPGQSWMAGDTNYIIFLIVIILSSAFYWFCIIIKGIIIKLLICTHCLTFILKNKGCTCYSRATIHIFQLSIFSTISHQFWKTKPMHTLCKYQYHLAGINQQRKNPIYFKCIWFAMCFFSILAPSVSVFGRPTFGDFQLFTQFYYSLG